MVKDSWLIQNYVIEYRNLLRKRGNPARFDPELITPLYVYRMWGGSVAIEEIAAGQMELRSNGFMEIGATCVDDI